MLVDLSWVLSPLRSALRRWKPKDIWHQEQRERKEAKVTKDRCTQAKGRLETSSADWGKEDPLGVSQRDVTLPTPRLELFTSRLMREWMASFEGIRFMQFTVAATGSGCPDLAAIISSILHIAASDWCLHFYQWRNESQKVKKLAPDQQSDLRFQCQAPFSVASVPWIQRQRLRVPHRSI